MDLSIFVCQFAKEVHLISFRLERGISLPEGAAERSCDGCSGLTNLLVTAAHLPQLQDLFGFHMVSR